VSAVVVMTALASLVQAAPVPEVVAGDEAAYLITVTNHGPSIARDVTVTDRLPPTLTVVSLPDGCRSAGRTVTCRLGRLGLDGTATLRVLVRVDPDAAGRTVANLARTAAATADPDRRNNEGSVSALVVGRSDVSVGKSGPAATAAGRRVRYVLTARNAGPSTARAVVLTDRLPAHLRLLRLPTACAASGRRVECSLERLAPGETRRYTLLARVRKGTPAGTVLLNRASIVSATPDPDPADNRAAVETTVVSRGSVCRTKAGSSSRCGAPPWRLQA
jgi:uncharacterized repeat protein (TIGR01451 family)